MRYLHTELWYENEKGLLRDEVYSSADARKHTCLAFSKAGFVCAICKAKSYYVSFDIVENKVLCFIVFSKSLFCKVSGKKLTFI